MLFRSYLDGELLPNETLVLFDVLQSGKYLIGSTLENRALILSEICGNPTELCDQKFALQVTSHIWLAQTGDSNFLENFNRFIKNDLIEGLVLKKKGSIMDNWGASEYEVDWQLRCRKPSKNYSF